MNSFVPPTITPVEDEQAIAIPQVSNFVENVPTITPVEPQPVQYVEQPVQQSIVIPQQQSVVVPVAQPVAQQEDLSRYYTILDQFGPVEPDDDFQLDGWTKFYLIGDPFFNWTKGAASPNWRVYNPENRMNLVVYEYLMEWEVDLVD